MSTAPAVTAPLHVGEIRWTLDESEPEPRPDAADVGPPPPVGSNSRTDVVAHWRWRFAALKAKNARVSDQLEQVLGEAQGYRQVSRAALDGLERLTRTTRRQSQTIERLIGELRNVRGPDTRTAT